MASAETSAGNTGASITDRLPSLPTPSVGSGAVHKVQNAQLVISLVVLGVVAIVGILIFSEVESAITVTGNLSDSVSDLEGHFGSSMSLVGIAMIVAVASLIIGFVAALGGRGPGGGFR